MKDFLKQLQLALVSVHAPVLGVKEVDPVLLPYSQHHGVLAVHLLKDGHRHVRDLVAGPVVVGADGFVQVGPGLAVCPRHTDPMLIHAGPELGLSLAAILLSAPGLLASDAVDHPTVAAGDGRVDDGHGVGVGGLHLLALLDIVAGGAVATLLHPFKLTLGPDVRVRGLGHLGSDELLPEARRPPVSNHGRHWEYLLEPGHILHHGAVSLVDD